MKRLSDIRDIGGILLPRQLQREFIASALNLPAL